MDNRWTQDILKLESLQLSEPRSKLAFADKLSDQDLVRRLDPYINWWSSKLYEVSASPNE